MAPLCMSSDWETDWLLFADWDSWEDSREICDFWREGEEALKLSKKDWICWLGLLGRVWDSGGGSVFRQLLRRRMAGPGCGDKVVTPREDLLSESSEIFSPTTPTTW